jgi:hypothetical protein
MLRKFLMVVAIAAVFSAVLTGCKVEGEVGDAATTIAQPQ